MRNIIVAAVCFLASGCGVVGSSLDGVWMFEASNPEVSCNTTYNTNLREAEIGGSGGSDWTTIDEYDQSLDIFFARIAHGRADDTVMVVADEIIPGKKLDDDTWEFSYVASVTDTDGRQHATGYWFRETYDTEIETTYTIIRENNRWLSGEAITTSRITERWDESDEWNANQTSVFSGEMPTFEVGAGENYYDDNDCLDPECFIVRETNCSDSRGLVGTWTGFEGNSNFEIENNYTSALE